ncbi:MAG: cytochrome c5 family protein [Pseudomonadales bacterium]|nr:cytochrome c5 family protein [Pseudomonadales bacterium]
MSKFSLLVVVLLASKSFAISADAQAAIAERIKPVGEVCVEGDKSCAGVVAKAASAEPRSGEEIFGASCTGCHSTGAAGAPKVGDKAAWAPRIAQGKATLYDHAKNGFNGMPPKGLCMDCTDDELKATVDYIVSKSQ